jgi:predicted transcriptional regulator
MSKVKYNDNRPIKKATSDDREKNVWALRVKGWSQQAIADELKISQPAVAQALKRAAEKHHETFMSDINAYKKQQAHIIQEAGLSALRQYVKSFEPLTSTIKSGVFDEKEKKFKGRVNTTIQWHSQNGDSKLLQAFFKSQEEIRKIWGFDIQPKTKDGKGIVDIESMTVEDKMALFISIPIEKRLELLDSMLTRNPVHDSVTALATDENEE